MKSAAGGNAPLLGIENERRFIGIIYNVENARQTGEYIKIHKPLSVFGIHSHGSCVDDDLGIGVAIDIFIIILSIKRDHLNL